MERIKLCAFADEAGKELSAQISALQRNGIPFLEIRGIDGKNIADITAAEGKEIKKRLDDGGIRVWSIGSPIGKCDIHEDASIELERLKRIVESACILEADNIRMFSFFKTTDADGEEVVERIGGFLDIAERSGISLCHENEKGIFGDSWEKCLYIQEALPALYSVFDPANFIQCGVDTKEAWENLSPYVKYLHAKDAIGARVVPCGMGEGNVPYIFGEYVKNGGGVITLEPHLTKFVGLDALESGDTSAVGGMSFPSADAAFDFAVDKVKNILNTL